MDDQWGPQVVVADAGGDPRSLGHLVSPYCLLGLAADGLFAEDGFTGRSRRFDHRNVQHVGSGHPHRVDVVCAHRIFPVLHRPLEPEVLDRAGTPRLLGVRADNQPGIDRPLRKQRGNAQHRSAVRLAHPAETENSNANVLLHGRDHLFLHSSGCRCHRQPRILFHSGPRFPDPVLVWVVAESHRAVLPRTGQDIQEIHRVLGVRNGRSVVALGHQIRVLVGDAQCLVVAAVHRVEAKEAGTRGISVRAVFTADAEVVDLLVHRHALADAVMAVRRPRRPVASRRDHLAHIDFVSAIERVRGRVVGHLPRGAAGAPDLNRNVVGRAVVDRERLRGPGGDDRDLA